jgi:hypothetical protein
MTRLRNRPERISNRDDAVVTEDSLARRLGSGDSIEELGTEEHAAAHCQEMEFLAVWPEGRFMLEMIVGDPESLRPGL